MVIALAIDSLAVTESEDVWPTVNTGAVSPDVTESVVIFPGFNTEESPEVTESVNILAGLKTWESLILTGSGSRSSSLGSKSTDELKALKLVSDAVTELENTAATALIVASLAVTVSEDTCPTSNTGALSVTVTDNTTKLVIGTTDILYDISGADAE